MTPFFSSSAAVSGEARIGRGVVLEHLVLDLRLAEQVAAKVGLAHPRPDLVILVATAAGRRCRGRSRRPEPSGPTACSSAAMVSRSARLRAGLETLWTEPLPKLLLAHDERAAVVLQRAGDDLGRRGAAGVDQDDDRQAVRHVARLGVEAFDVVLVAAALGDDLAALEEGVADLDRLVEQAAGVGAQVDDIAQRLAAGRLVDRGQRRFGRVRRCCREAVDVDDADAVLDFPLDRPKLDPLAGDARRRTACRGRGGRWSA